MFAETLQGVIIYNMSMIYIHITIITGIYAIMLFEYVLKEWKGGGGCHQRRKVTVL